MTAMLSSDLPLPRIGRGKVRDIYAVGEDRVLLLTTDRISAFDVVMAETIPMKGAVLTQISAWWFRQLEATVPHHMISADADEIIREVPALENHRADILGRAMLCKRTTVFPIECVIRGYLSGSAWREYSKSGTLAGEKLPRGLKESEIPDPTAEENILKTSGRGIFLIRSFMDEVRIRDLHPGTEITLVKHVTPLTETKES